ncbi:unknown [Acidaminococcus sp. CAG:542]|nr:unknown [Acidaminococcus sp. CAG:542]
MAKSQDPSFIVCPGYRADGSDDHISPDHGNPHGTSRFQLHIVQLFRPSRHGIGGKAERRQVFVQMGHPVSGKTADHERGALGQEDGRPGIGLVKEPEHFVDGGQETVVGVGKSLTIGHGSGQPAVDVHRAAAHALGDAPAFLQQRAGRLDQDVVAPGFRTGDPQDFHIKGFDVRSPDHCFPISLHARFQLFHGNGGNGGTYQGNRRHKAAQGQHQEPLPLETTHNSSCKKEGVTVYFTPSGSCNYQ